MIAPPQSLRNRIWRDFLMVVHRWPVHPGWRHPMRFYEYGCILCRIQWRSMQKHLPPEALMDRSTIKVSEPEYDEAGKLKRRGIVMSATAQRQLDEIFAKDPDARKAVEKAIDDIANDPT